MSESLTPDDAEVTARARRLLDRSVEEMDQATILRLQRVRRSILSPEPAKSWQWSWAGGLAMAVIGLLAVLMWTDLRQKDNHHAPLLEDMELVLSPENVELAEDLEFYHWLADADQTG
ncbi:MAG TPA: hypothetical protein VFS39_19410 [Nitrospira sp.]|nr:hypothetical protein [Nitrospira sp.]